MNFVALLTLVTQLKVLIGPILLDSNVHDRYFDPESLAIIILYLFIDNFY